MSNTTHTPSKGPVSGHRLAILVSSGSSRHLVEHVKRRFEALGATAELIVPDGADCLFDDRTPIDADYALSEIASTAFDFVVVLPGLDVEQDTGSAIMAWAEAARCTARPMAIGSQAATQLGVGIDHTAVFDVSTCEAFVQACESDARAREGRLVG